MTTHSLPVNLQVDWIFTFDPMTSKSTEVVCSSGYIYQYVPSLMSVSLIGDYIYIVSKIKYRMMCLFDKNNSLIYWLDISLQINVQSHLTFDLVGSKSIRPSSVYWLFMYQKGKGPKDIDWTTLSLPTNMPAKILTLTWDFVKCFSPVWWHRYPTCCINKFGQSVSQCLRIL